MQVFVMLCFQKEAVLYFIENGKAEKCYYRGNDTLSLDWDNSQFEEIWKYFVDVVNVDTIANTQIIIYCPSIKGFSIWDKLSYPVSQNIKGISFQEFSVLLPNIAKMQGVADEREINFAWRNYIWKVSENSCVASEGEIEKELSDENFINLIVKFLEINTFDYKSLREIEQERIKQIDDLSKKVEELNKIEELSKKIDELNDKPLYHVLKNIKLPGFLSKNKSKKE